MASIQAATTVPDLLRRSGRLVADHLSALSVTAALVQFPVTAVLAVTLPTIPTSELTGAGAARALAGLIEVYPIIALAQVAMMGALVVLIKDATTGRALEPAAAYKRVAASLGALVLTALIIGAAMALGMVVILPAAAAAVFWCLAVQVVMLEGRAFGTALGRSARLVARRFWRVIGLLAALAVLQGVIAAIGEVPYLFVGGPIAQVGSETLSALLTVTVGLVPVVALTLLYFDLVEAERDTEQAAPAPDA